MTETLKVKLNDEQVAYIIYKVTEKLMFDANRIKVVRCKECKHWDTDWVPSGTEENKAEMHFCGVVGRVTPNNHYCSYGERREE